MLPVSDLGKNHFFFLKNNQFADKQRDMPKIVELLGPSGVGKSSLYFSLQKKWNKDDRWAIYHDFIYQRKNNTIVSTLLKLRSLKYKVSNTDYLWNDGKITDQKKEFASRYPEFMSVFLDLVNDNAKYGFNGEDKRFFIIYYMLKSMERLHNVLERTGDNRICLIDEALLSRIMHLNSPEFTRDDLLSYLNAMPLPDAVIYLNASPDKIVRRIQKRARTSTLHQGLEDNDILKYTINTQSLMEFSLEVLKEKGVNILTLDAGQPLQALTSEVIQYLNQLYTSG
jgi:thymidylate kinase